jgi:hypothetical protein
MAGGGSRTWESARLWKELDSREEEPAPKLRLFLESTLPDVETVLNKGGTAPWNFTLHDGDHSWRVAEWMAELAGDDLMREMSSDELGLLLCSAYLHDIGMTPQAGKISDIHHLLLSGEPGEMTTAEVDELQAWLDEEWDGRTSPLTFDNPSRKDLLLASQITASFVRSQHNEWSEEWIRDYFEDKKTPYSRWVDQLVRLCKSHHEGADELASEAFRPQLFDSPSQIIHLRYCACLLRVADILDFDPERTPRILFEHRDVEDISAIFWQKDREISFRKEGDRLELNAEPTDALIHHAIVETVEAVNRELRLCRRLDDETNFQHRPGSKRALPHRWTLDPTVAEMITPADKSYTYIDGTFRPDAQRLLELVGGFELYRTPRAALRELLQNAFDAVREQMARERLGKRNPGGPKARADAAAGHEVSVSISVAEDQSGIKLTCTDTGVGMSREIISKRLLVGGSTPGHDIRRLERECAANGFSLGRTAQFGIGVLSYFLLANRLVIHTCRSKAGGGRDGTGWTFSSLGLTDFGELRRDENLPKGTSVEFHIDLGEGESAGELVATLAEYIQTTVRRSPCAFSFSAPDFEGFDFEFDDWPDREEEIRDELEDELTEEELDALVLRSHTGRLPNELGTYRVYLGHFEAGVGPALAYMKLVPAGQNQYEVRTDAKGEGIQLGRMFSQSWNGMHIDDTGDLDWPPENAMVEIDWTSSEAGRLLVSRDLYEPSESAVVAVQFVNEKVAELLRDLVMEQVDSPPALLNLLQLDETTQRFTAPPSPYWRHDGGDDDDAKWYFAPLAPPVVDRRPWSDSTNFTWRGNRVAVPAVIELRPAGGGRSHWNWYGWSKPQYVGAVETERGIEPIGIWEKIKPYKATPYTPRKAAAHFPPEWRAVAGVSILWPLGGTIWNHQHPLLQPVDRESWQWARDTFKDKANDEDFGLTSTNPSPMDPRPHLAELLEADGDSEGRVAAWILRCLQRAGPLWEQLANDAPEVLRAAWGMIDGLEELGKIVFYEQENEPKIVVVTSSTWETLEGEQASQAFARELQMPREKWQLVPEPA